MSGKIQKLRQELTTIEEMVRELAVKIEEKYTNYFKLLSQAVYQQLVLAVYQICTQAYPQEFLNLAHSQRQKLQEDIKTIAKTTQTKLLKLLEADQQLSETPSLDFSKNPFLASFEGQERLSPASFSLLSPNVPEKKIEKDNDPDSLLNWCKTLEKAIVDILNNISKEINHHLQKAHILPSNLPSQVLDMAIQVEENGQPMSGGANLLNVLIEADHKNQEISEEEIEEPLFPAKITKITAIHLRLIEIEFADPSLSIERQQIRSLLEQLNQIRQQYHKKQKEYAVAEAESAWRSSWYEG